MNNNYLSQYTMCLLLLVLLLSFNSCESNCKDEVIEKVEWITGYNTRMIDTLVNYVVVTDEISFNDTTKRVKHVVSLKNLNSAYANEFAVRFFYGYGRMLGEETSFKEYETDYLVIDSDSTKVFEFERQAMYYNNFNSSIEVLQKGKEIEVKKWYDSLKVEQITLNTCVEDVDVIKEKYNTIRKLYTEKTEKKN